MGMGADSAWHAKGSTLSDKFARKEFGIAQEVIIDVIRGGKPCSTALLLWGCCGAGMVGCNLKGEGCKPRDFYTRMRTTDIDHRKRQSQVILVCGDSQAWVLNLPSIFFLFHQKR